MSFSVVRDNKLDFYKGCLIWSIVLGHCLNVFCPRGSELHVLLRTFDLPMFMYISGFLLRGSLAKYEWKQLLMNKATTLVMPALIWAGVSFLCGDRCWYYFLWAVFFSCAVVICAHTFCKWAWMKWVMLIGVAVLFHIVPVNVANMSYLFPFFLLGYVSRRIVPVAWKWGLVSLAVFVVLLIGFWSSQYSIWKSGGYVLSAPEYMIPVVLLRLAIGVAGIYAASFLLGLVHDKSGHTVGVGFFERLGRETLALYVMQHVVVEIWMQRLATVGEGCLRSVPSWLMGYVVAPVVSLALLMVMCELALLLKKSDYSKWVFGVKLVK